MLDLLNAAEEEWMYSEPQAGVLPSFNASKQALYKGLYDKARRFASEGRSALQGTGSANLRLFDDRKRFFWGG